MPNNSKPAKAGRAADAAGTGRPQHRPCPDLSQHLDTEAERTQAGLELVLAGVRHLVDALTLIEDEPTKAAVAEAWKKALGAKSAASRRLLRLRGEVI